MTALSYLLMCFLYFICIGIDVTLFFLQIRLILMWRNIRWLTPFDNAGNPIVDFVIAKVPLLVKINKPLSKRGKIVIAALAMLIVRVILSEILKLK